MKHDIDKLITGTLSGVESSLSCLLAVPPVIKTQALNDIGTEDLYHEPENQRNKHHHISIKGAYDAER